MQFRITNQPSAWHYIKKACFKGILKGLVYIWQGVGVAVAIRLCLWILDIKI